MTIQEILQKRYTRESQSYTESQAKIAYKNGVFDWDNYTLLINDQIVEKIKAESPEAAKKALYDLYRLNPGDYVKVVKVVTIYETVHENYEPSRKGE